MKNNKVFRDDKPQKERQNYFSRNIQKKGENFIAYKNPAEMQREAINVFRDIARGNIDIKKYSNFFLDKTFLENLIAAANCKMLIECTLRDGITLLYNDKVRLNQSCDLELAVLQNQISKADAYVIIFQNLCNLNVSGDIGWLFTLASSLEPYRYII